MIRTVSTQYHPLLRCGHVEGGTTAVAYRVSAGLSYFDYTSSIPPAAIIRHHKPQALLGIVEPK